MKRRFLRWCDGLAGATTVLALAIAPLAGQTVTGSEGNRGQSRHLELGGAGGARDPFGGRE